MTTQSVLWNSVTEGEALSNDSLRWCCPTDWWFKEHELDILGLTDDGLVAGECKFTSTPVSEGVLSDIERTTEEVQWSESPADGEPLYVLFSRSGYTDDLERTADNRDDVRLFDLTDLVPEQ